jgi:hypothetical protein
MTAEEKKKVAVDFLRLAGQGHPRAMHEPPRPILLHWRVLFLALAVDLGGGCTRRGDNPTPANGADAGAADGPADQAFDSASVDRAADHTADVITPTAGSITEGSYRACQDFEVISPSTGCICSSPAANSTVCLPTCKTDTDCPAAPPGGPAAKCMEATGGLFSYCVMPCQAGASASACPSGYSCSGSRSNIGPFCAVPGSDISDLSSRYDSMPFDNHQPATPVGPARRLCGAAVVLSGELTAGDLNLQRSLRVKSGCLPSPPGYLYLEDVHAVELVGPGPHDLDLNSCGHAPYRMSVMLFHRPDSTTPYDTSSVCRNLLAFADPSARGDCGGGVSARFVGLQAGTVYVVVSSETPGKSGSYELTVTSGTSRCP